MSRILSACTVVLLAVSSYSYGLSPQRPSPAEPGAQATPTPQTHKRRSISEVEEAMAKGQELLFKQHNAKASLEEFKRASKLDPWYGQAYFLQGLAHMQLQQWSEAQWAFEEAVKVEPGNAKAYLGAGSALNEQKDFAGAQKALQSSLEIQPDSAEAQYELARSLWGQNKWQAAEPHVRRAIEINKDYAGPHALLGNIDIQKEDPQSALAEFQECLRLDPEGSLAPQVKQIIAQLKQALGQ